MSLCQIQVKSTVVTNIYNINLLIAGLSVKYIFFRWLKILFSGILVSVNKQEYEYILKYILLHINLGNYKIFPINILETLAKVKRKEKK